MAKRTEATSWEDLGRDETGTLINADFTCPKCHCDTGKIILIGAENLDYIDSPFEADVECPECGADIIVEFT